MDKKFKYEEVFKNSTKYFSGDELASKVFVDKYALRNENGEYLELTPKDMHIRLAKEFRRIEKNKYEDGISLKYEDIFNAFDKFKYIVPQGSPMFGIGNNFQKISLSNCFAVESPADSYGSICKADEEIVQISKRRGGVGIDVSNLRPRGFHTKNAAQSSTGVISFMERFSNSIREVGQSGRRGALMITIDVHHPQVIDFARSKRDLTKITGGNISIRFSDEFLEAVKNNVKYEQRFPVDYKDQGVEPILSRMVDAKEVWDAIVENSHATAEPGVLFWDTILNNSPVDCYKDYGFKTITTNPCSEIPLSDSDSCRLMVLNLYNFVDDPFTENSKFNWEKFRLYGRMAQRLMDDLIDMEIEKIDEILKKVDTDPEREDVKYTEMTLWKKIKAAAVNGRRTGTGITALGDTIAALGIGYDSEDAIKFAEKMYKELKLACYGESVEMAKLLGPFSVWNSKLEQGNIFIDRLKNDDIKLWGKMQTHGRRNIACNTIAPTGCLEKNAIINTDRGMITLETLFSLNDINIDGLKNDKNVWFDATENINVIDVNGKKRKINKLYWNGYVDGFKFKFNDGFEIKTSKTHKFLVLVEKNKGVWKEGNELNPGDKIIKLK